jgi:hypothetical protein
MKRTMMFLALAALFLLAGNALAMSSANYRLDWYTPLTSSGGGPAGSASYAVNLTVGQTAIGFASSSSYQACLGYWCGAVGSWRVYLPLVLK